MPLKGLTVKWKLRCWVGGLFCDFRRRLDWIMVVFMEEYSSENLKPLRILNIFHTNPNFTPGRFEDQHNFLEAGKTVLM